MDVKKVLVTGGAGYIGSNCVEYLLNHDLQVLVFDNLSEGHRKAVDTRAQWVEGDLADSTLLTQTMKDFRPDAVMHFAANALVGESMEKPMKYFRNNVGGGMNLLEAMLEAQVRRIIFSSTCATFGIPDQIPIHENVPQNPVNPYGRSKLMFEQMLHWFSELHDLQTVILRYFNAAGASENFGEDHRVETHLIPNVIKVAQGQKESVHIFGTDYPTPDGTCIRDYIHILDLAQAHFLALGCNSSNHFNLGTGGGNSVREVIDAVQQVSGRNIQVEEKPRRPGDPPRLIADAHKARETLGWSPEFQDINTIIESAWRWHVDHPNGYED
ncbi:MAG: UDP-glucose 4-epimerase GalE [Verrucomicrobiota bacterium]